MTTVARQPCPVRQRPPSPLPSPAPPPPPRHGGRRGRRRRSVALGRRRRRRQRRPLPPASPPRRAVGQVGWAPVGHNDRQRCSRGGRPIGAHAGARAAATGAHHGPASAPVAPPTTSHARGQGPPPPRPHPPPTDARRPSLCRRRYHRRSPPAVEPSPHPSWERVWGRPIPTTATRHAADATAAIPTRTSTCGRGSPPLLPAAYRQLPLRWQRQRCRPPLGVPDANSNAATSGPPTLVGVGAADKHTSGTTTGRPTIQVKGVGVADVPPDGAPPAHLLQRWGGAQHQSQRLHASVSPPAARCDRRGRHSYAMHGAQVRGEGTGRSGRAGMRGVEAETGSAGSRVRGEGPGQCVTRDAGYVQPFSRKSLTATVPKVFQIGLCGVVEADLELFCNSWSAGFLGERLYDSNPVQAGGCLTRGNSSVKPDRVACDTTV